LCKDVSNRFRPPEKDGRMLKVKCGQTPKGTRTDPMRLESDLGSPVNPPLRKFLFDQLFQVLL
jgi:hypothetical protein